MKKIGIALTVLVVALAALIFFLNHDTGEKEVKPVEKYADLSVTDVINNSSELIGQGDLVKAVEMLSEKLTKNPDNPLLHYNLGVALMGQKTYQDAISEFTLALELQENIGALNNRAYSYTMIGEVDKAIDDYTELIKQKDDFGVAYLKRAQLYLGKNMKGEAITDLKKASELGIAQADTLLQALK